MSAARGQDVDELVAKYKLHPEFRDVYVEGESDQGLVQWFLEENDVRGVNVYPITSFEIPVEIVTSYGLGTPSARNNNLALGMELEKRIGSGVHVRCIVDSDFDRIEQRRYETKVVLFTDYTSMEMYAYQREVVQKFVRIVAPKIKKDGDQILNDLEPTLETLSAMRVANLQLGYGLSWVSFERCCTYQEAKIHLDEEELLCRYLNTNGRPSQFMRFKKLTESLKASFGGADPRHHIRGHDFVDVLTWYLRQRPSCRHLTVDSVRQALYGA